MIACQLGVSEAFVVAKVQIGLRTVICDIYFAVLIRAHGARIHVQIRIAFLECDSETAAFQKTANRRRCNTLAQGGYNTTGYKNILRRHPLSSSRLKNKRLRNGLNPPKRCWRTTHSTGEGVLLST